MSPNGTAPASALRSPVQPGVRRPRGDRRLPPRPAPGLVPAPHPLVFPAPRRSSFIDQELRGSASDLLFEVRSAAAAPRQWPYLLFEHQSQPDRWMALRLLRYCCRIWENDRRDHPDEQYLRPVLPLVFYQGEHHWHYAIELAESFPPARHGAGRAPPIVLLGGRVLHGQRRAALQSAADAAPL